MTARRIGPAAVAVALAALLAGCAGKAPPQPDHDPWEPLNRKVFAFNDWLDRNLLEPVARGWDHAWPDPVEHRISDFMNTLRFPGEFTNSILQGSPRGAAVALARLQINVFMGGLGFYDLAADLGLPPQKLDFGQTFGKWGIASGPYLVLPFFGPSSPRDTVGLACDIGIDFYQYFIVIPGITTVVAAVNVVNQRAQFLDTIEELRNASLDYYTAVRNAYVQRRFRLIHGEEPPTGAEQEDLYDADVFEEYMEEGDVE